MLLKSVFLLSLNQDIHWTAYFIVLNKNNNNFLIENHEYALRFYILIIYEYSYCWVGKI